MHEQGRDYIYVCKCYFSSKCVAFIVDIITSFCDFHSALFSELSLIDTYRQLTNVQIGQASALLNIGSRGYLYVCNDCCMYVKTVVSVMMPEKIYWGGASAIKVLKLRSVKVFYQIAPIILSKKTKKVHGFHESAYREAC